MEHKSILENDISVLIISNRGEKALLRSIENVRSQEISSRLEIIICSDCDLNLEQIDRIEAQSTDSINIQVYGISGSSRYSSLYPAKRVSRLRNIAISFATKEHICFLDDDNGWEKNHLNSLLLLMSQANLHAAYSWRKVVLRNNIKWEGDHFPWGTDTVRKHEIYDELSAQGLIKINSPIFRDSHLSTFKGEPLPTVDMGSWLFRADMIKNIAFEVNYSEYDINNSITEDDKLLMNIIKHPYKLACTNNPTLIYTLGGYSNR